MFKQVSWFFKTTCSEHSVYNIQSDDNIISSFSVFCLENAQNGKFYWKPFIILNIFKLFITGGGGKGRAWGQEGREKGMGWEGRG